jgi:hypothetical protein
MHPYLAHVPRHVPHHVQTSSEQGDISGTERARLPMYGDMGFAFQNVDPLVETEFEIVTPWPARPFSCGEGPINRSASPQVHGLRAAWHSGSVGSSLALQLLCIRMEYLHSLSIELRHRD